MKLQYALVCVGVMSGCVGLVGSRTENDAGTTGGGDATGGGGGDATGGGAATGGGTPTIVSPSCDQPTPAFTAQEQALVDLPADSWWTAPNSRLDSVTPMGWTGNVIIPWSGGAYDANHHLMFLWGGGHGDYGGNELYAFDLASLSWRLMTMPSTATPDQDPQPDGRPQSRHTYDGLEFLTHANRFWAHGGSGYGAGGGTNKTWVFEVENTTWTLKNPTPDLPLTNCCSDGALYDPVTKKVFVHRTHRIATYDYDANRWDSLQDFGAPPYWPRYENWGDKVGVLDSKRRLGWFIGGDTYLVWDLDHSMAVTDSWVSSGGTSGNNASLVGGHTEQLFTSGGAEIWKGQGPGIDYDPTSDTLVGWVGGGPWVLDLTSKAWTRKSGTGAPASPSQHGTYGRWRYIPRLNVFVLVNATDANVTFYKHTPRCGR